MVRKPASRLWGSQSKQQQRAANVGQRAADTVRKKAAAVQLKVAQIWSAVTAAATYALAIAQALLAAALHLLLIPSWVLRALLLLPRSFVFDTPQHPAHRRPVGAKRKPPKTAAKNRLPRQPAQSPLRTLPKGTALQRRLSAAGAALAAPDFCIVVRRIIAAYNASLLVLWHATAYNALVVAVRVLRLQPAGRAAGALLQRIMAALFIGQYHTAHGEDVYYSVVNAVSPTFALLPGYSPKTDLPAKPEPTNTPAVALADDAPTAHLAALAAKLAYEDAAMIKDVVVNQWGLTWLAEQKVRLQAIGTAVPTPPEISWFAACNERAALLAFRGTSPLDMLNWETDVDIGLTRQPGMGAVHNGFLAALFQLPENSQTCVFDKVMSSLHQVLGRRKQLFITGHSLGGALASVFAQALQVKRPESVEQVAGIYTFGQPRVGDSEYVDRFFHAYGGRSFRFVHASDVVAKVPASMGYVHHPAERYITSFPLAEERVLRAELYADSIEAWRNFEASAVIPLTLLKLLTAPLRGDSHLYAIARLLLLPLPGLADHMPAEYERTLREAAAPVMRRRVLWGAAGKAMAAQSRGMTRDTSTESVEM